MHNRVLITGMFMAWIMLMPLAAPLAVWDSTSPERIGPVQPPLGAVVPWLDPEPALPFPSSAQDVIDSFLPSAGAVPPILNGWVAYFAAIELEPDAAEREALHRLSVLHPHLSARLEELAYHVAVATIAREEAFAAIPEGDWPLAVEAVVLTAMGNADRLTAAHEAVLARIDLDKLSEAARLLLDTAIASDPPLRQAMQMDDAIADALPPGLRDPRSLQDPAATLKAIAGEVDGIVFDASLADLLFALALLEDIPLGLVTPPVLPADLESPLVNILAAFVQHQRSPSEISGAVVIATIASELPALTRASYNYSLQSPGQIARLEAAPGPLFSMQVNAGEAPLAVLADIAGPATTHAPESFVRALERLHLATGGSLTAADRIRAEQLSSSLDPGLVSAMSDLIVAQAEYERVLGPNSPLPSRVETLAEAARPILEASGPLTTRDIELLQESATANSEYRRTVGELGGAIYQAALTLSQGSWTVPTSANGLDLHDILYDDQRVVVSGVGDTEFTSDRWARPPILIVDLGGNDTYRIPVGSVNLSGAVLGVPTSPEEARTSVLVDLGGNDRYESDGPWAFGAARGAPGIPAFGLLIDAAGDDVYLAESESLGWGLDGMGILVDLSGHDFYESRGTGMAGASTTTPQSIAAGILVDAHGMDSYRNDRGFGHLYGNASSPATYAVFLDLGGADTYGSNCPSGRDCFGTPRVDEADPSNGFILFADTHGGDSWPRQSDPNPTVNPDGNQIVQGQSTERVVYVLSTPSAVDPVDSDGDFLPDILEELIRTDPRDPDSPGRNLDDSDGDGYPDLVENLLGTDPHDPDDYPAGIPDSPEGVPSPYDVIPELGDLAPSQGNGFIVQIPGLLAIGNAQPTTYVREYRFIIDLGMGGGAEARDRYQNATASNGFVIDMGGDDTYHPQAQGSGAIPALAAATGGETALLLDMGGNDVYYSETPGQAYARGTHSESPFISSTAILMDVGGNDVYEAPAGLSQAYSVDGGLAYFLDLSGNDLYLAPTQGVVGNRTSAGNLAYFLDFEGDDVYDRGPSPIGLSNRDTYQGFVATDAGPRVVAAFLDLDGDDQYWVFARETRERVDLAAEKNNHLRVRPVENLSSLATSIFLDTAPLHPSSGVADSDGDSNPDVVETVAGTDAGDEEDHAYSSSGDLDDPSGYVLRLPRLGLAVGSSSATVYPAGVDYALLVDLGGNDLYRNRPGASSPMWGAALAIDLGGNDVYDHRGTTNFSTYLRHGIERVSLPDRFIDAAYGGTQGAGIFGVGVLYNAAGANQFSMNASVTGCERCTAPSYGLGLGQGAGLAGVGVLYLPDGASATFLSEVDVKGPVEGVEHTLAAQAYNHAQGAGILGTGILIAQDPLLDNVYELKATAFGKNMSSASYGQGVGTRGIGILVDGGGNNTFVAQTFSQGAASDGVHAVREGPRDGPEKLRGSVGMLLLTGNGNDKLTAVNQSQAYASTNGFAVLYDAEGNDVRTLIPTQGSHAMGQAAAEWGGVAYLVDRRGNDVYEATGPRAQGFGTNEGVALLIDLAGADRYSAGALSQGAGAGTRGFGVLLDREGNDIYMLPPNARGRGSVAEDAANAFGLFLDLGGGDIYVGNPKDREAAPGHSFSSDGNDWVWIVSSSGRPHGIGIDDSSITNAWAMLLDAEYCIDAPSAPATSTFSSFLIESGHAVCASARDHLAAQIRVVNVEEGPLSGPLNGTVRIIGELRDATSRVPIDRAEFYFDNTYLASGNQRMDGAYGHDWPTDELTANGRFRFPDGKHAVEVMLHPQVRTPDAQGRSVGADPEPFRATGIFAIDNPPLPRWPTLPADVKADSVMDLWVDRDLDQEDGVCPACNGNVFLLPGENDWLMLPDEDPYGHLANHPCNQIACFPNVTLLEGMQRVFLEWKPPLWEADVVVGYKVFHVWNLSTGLEYEVAGFVDARSPLRFVHEPGVTPAEYLVAPVRLDPSFRDARLSNATVAIRSVNTSWQPEPATGLEARGAEGGVALVWNPVEGATSYRIERGTDPALLMPIDEVGDHSYIDDDVVADVTFHYRVTPLNAAGEGAPTRLVSTRASPGHEVTLELLGETVSYTLLQDVSFGGDWEHKVPWAHLVREVPDGNYVLAVTQTDAAQRSATSLTEIAVDRQPPVTHVGLPQWVGGSYNTPQGIQIPITVHEATSLPKHTVVHVQEGERAWRTFHVDWAKLTDSADAGPDYHSHVHVSGLNHGSTLRIIARSEDAAGNVEGLMRERAWRAGLSDAIEDARDGGAWSTHHIDIIPPLAHVEPSHRIVRPGDLVHLSVLPFESGSGIESVTANVGVHVVPLLPTGTGRYSGTWVAAGEGRMTMSVVMVDRAGNVGETPLGAVTVDAEPPMVESLTVTFPGGRTVGRAGEVVTLLVSASDDRTDRESLVIHADVSNVSSRESVRLAWDSRAKTHRAEFTVDRVSSRETSNITLSLYDYAGNVRQETLAVKIDGTPVDMGEPVIVNVSATEVLVNWTTTEPVRGRLDYGQGGQIAERSPVSPKGTEHSLRISGLTPDAVHVIRAVSITDAGVETLSPLLSFRTAPGLEVRLSAGQGLIYSRGSFEVDASVVRYDGVPVDADVALELTPPRGPSRHITTIQAGERVVIDLRDERDGIYKIQPHARKGDLAAAGDPLTVVLDRVPPLLSLEHRAVVVPGQNLTLRVQEAGSGVDFERVRWMIGGRICPLTEIEGHVVCHVPDMKDMQEAVIEVDVPDRAGNVGSIHARLTVDSEPPKVTGARFETYDGFAYLRPGVMATLHVNVGDVTATNATVDLTAFRGDPAAPMEQISLGIHRIEVNVPASLPDGDYDVPVDVVDSAGRVTSMVAIARVDGQAPTVVQQRVDPVNPTSAALLVRSDEPVKVKLRLPNGTLHESKGFLKDQSVQITNLRPGQELRIAVTIIDRAGNEFSFIADGRSSYDTKAPSAVRDLRAIDSGQGIVELRWSEAVDDVGMEGYRILRLSGVEEKEIAFVTGLTFRDEVPVGQTVRFRVVPIDLAGNAGNSATTVISSQPRPGLTNGTVDPPVGGPGMYEFRVDVYDASGGTPQVGVRLNGVMHVMTPDTQGCAAGCTYRAFLAVGVQTFASGPHTHSFHVLSGTFRSSLPESEPFEGPLVLADAGAPRAAELLSASKIPSIGTAGALLVALCGVIVLLILRRRHSP